MKETILQAVIEVPMSRRQALVAARELPKMYAKFGLEGVILTGYSILRGLTFVEMLLQIDEKAELKVVAQAALMGFVVEAEGVAKGGESEEFAVVFAEAFWAGREWEPEPVLLPTEADKVGIGGTNPENDLEWAKLLSRYYNPAAREPNEVNFRRYPLR